MNKRLAMILLGIVAVIWGGGFIATKIAVDLGVSTGILNMFRGAIFSFLVYITFRKHIHKMTKEQLKVGLVVGVCNCAGFVIQALGSKYTTPSNSSFLTTTNVVMVPFLVWIIYKIKPKVKNFIAVGVCLFGMAILSGVFHSHFVLNIGDIYSVICAFFFALSIVLLSKQPEGGHYANSAFLMGVTLFLGSFIYFLIVEKAVVPHIDWKATILPILYLSVGSNFIAQTIQVLAQQHLTASTASLIMLFEGVFGSIFSVLFGFEPFTASLLIGGVLILTSLVINEVTFTKKKNHKTYTDEE